MKKKNVDFFVKYVTLILVESTNKFTRLLIIIVSYLPNLAVDSSRYSFFLMSQPQSSEHRVEKEPTLPSPARIQGQAGQVTWCKDKHATYSTTVSGT